MMARINLSSNQFIKLIYFEEEAYAFNPSMIGLNWKGNKQTNHRLF